MISSTLVFHPPVIIDLLLACRTGCRHVTGDVTLALEPAVKSLEAPPCHLQGCQGGSRGCAPSLLPPALRHSHVVPVKVAWAGAAGGKKLGSATESGVQAFYRHRWLRLPFPPPFSFHFSVSSSHFPAIISSARNPECRTYSSEKKENPDSWWSFHGENQELWVMHPPQLLGPAFLSDSFVHSFRFSGWIFLPLSFFPSFLPSLSRSGIDRWMILKQLFLGWIVGQQRHSSRPNQETCSAPQR